MDKSRVKLLDCFAAQISHFCSRNIGISKTRASAISSMTPVTFQASCETTECTNLEDCLLCSSFRYLKPSSFKRDSAFVISTLEQVAGLVQYQNGKLSRVFNARRSSLSPVSDVVSRYFNKLLVVCDFIKALLNSTWFLPFTGHPMARKTTTETIFIMPVR